jgi:hypothetical protein
MALAKDLLHQAHHLAVWDEGRPRQANLRRSISSAYYALFHLLAAASVRLTVPASPNELQSRVARSISHTEMKDACVSVLKPNPGALLLQLSPQGFSADIKKVAKAFLLLQEQRHSADYDTGALFSRGATLRLIQQTEEAFTAWNRVTRLPEAQLFLCAILFAKRWSK